MWKKIKPYILFPAATLAAGGLAALIAGGTEIYKYIERPPLSPPSWLFPVVWTVLYILIGVAAAIVYSSNDLDKGKALKFYWLQLAVNMIWPILFFGFRMFAFSIIWLILLILLAAVTTVKFFEIEKTAGCLMLPYIVWCLFALYLNFGIAILN